MVKNNNNNLYPALYLTSEQVTTLLSEQYAPSKPDVSIAQHQYEVISARPIIDTVEREPGFKEGSRSSVLETAEERTDHLDPERATCVYFNMNQY